MNDLTHLPSCVGFVPRLAAQCGWEPQFREREGVAGRGADTTSTSTLSRQADVARLSRQLEMRLVWSLDGFVSTFWCGHHSVRLGFLNDSKRIGYRLSAAVMNSQLLTVGVVQPVKASWKWCSNARSLQAPKQNTLKMCKPSWMVERREDWSRRWTIDNVVDDVNVS